MKINLIRAIGFVVLGIALLATSLLAKNVLTEKWTSFFFGFSLPLLVGAVVQLVRYFKKKKEADTLN